MSTLSKEIHPPRRTGEQRSFRRIFPAAVTIVLVLVGILLVTLASHPANRDYIEYWTAGKLLLHHSNPYSATGIFSIEKAHGFTGTSPLIMLNPPWMLFLIAPLGFCTVREGMFLWTLAAVACVLLTVRILTVPSNIRGFAFVFAPFVACMFSSQSSPFLLLGFALFLRFHRSYPFWAGASLLLMAIKPHLLLIFWAVLLVDAIYRRQARILAGFVAALAAASAFPLFFDLRIWEHYFAFALRYKAVRQAFLPNASMLFRAIIDVHAFWLLFIPSAFAIFWGLWYYARNRKMWAWTHHGMLLMLVTILASPYSYFSDELILLPAILFALSSPEKRKHSAWLLIAINSVALYLVLVDHANLSSRAYMWTPVTWLAWFLYAAPRSSRDVASDGIVSLA